MVKNKMPSALTLPQRIRRNPEAETLDVARAQVHGLRMALACGSEAPSHALQTHCETLLQPKVPGPSSNVSVVQPDVVRWMR